MTAPRVSIVMPVRDREALTKRCLAAIAADPPNVSWELIVVDDGSGDGTPRLLASLEEPMRALRRPASAGFATACNEGAATARASDWLLFLNNDTLPHPGWLDALLELGDESGRTAAVGSKLLYPDGSVQHAGVVFGQDGYPRHLYTGLPGDHPAVGHARRLQAVTAACALVRRDAFDAAGGFDTGYRNGLEDVDLFLRLGEAGWEVRYCPASVLTHMESVTRGRQSEDRREGERLYRERWRDRVRRDDLEAYVEDGLLSVRYSETHPIELRVSPELAICVHDGGDEALGRLVRAFSRRATELLGDAVRLSARVAELELGARRDGTPPARVAGPEVESADALLRELDRLQVELAGLQETAGEAQDGVSYRSLIVALREAVEDHVPEGSTVLVISKGDDDLVDLGDRSALHFPQAVGGDYAGHHPADSDEAIAGLERMRESGADFLVVPQASSWWLDHYAGFAAHLARYGTVLDGPHCRIVALRRDG
jgi:GT2 family glycosyltransferase